MAEEHFFGLDLGEEITQLSVYSERTQAPESVSLSGQERDYLMPAVICCKETSGEWFAGEEALRVASRGGTELVRGLLERLRRGQEIRLGENFYTPEYLMERYLKRVLNTLRLRCGMEITKLAVTVDRLTDELREKLLQIFLGLGLQEDQLVFLTRTECFMYYTIHTKAELWTNDVALFDYDGTRFYYNKLSFARKRRPIAVTADQMDFTEELREHRKPDEPDERRAHWFYETAMQLFHKQYITTVYVTGLGFDGGWAGDALQKLCNGRRVFQGQNLYTKGACYAAHMLSKEENEDFVFLTGEMVKESIALRLYQNTKNEFVQLSVAGTPYRQIKKRLRVILDATDELEFFVDDMLQKEPRHEVMILENLLQKENKTTQLELELLYVDRDTPVMRVRDVGFLKERSSGRIWEQIL